MASKEPFKKKKLEYNVDQSTVDKILKKRFGTEKKPKKFTWKGLMNAASILETNPFDPISISYISIVSVIDTLTAEQSGKFLNYDGQVIPW